MKRSVVAIFVVAGWTLACTGGETATVDTEPQNTCDLTPDTLSGKAFVRQTQNETNGWDPDPLARVRFETKDGALKAKYTVRSLNSVYDYTCSKKDEDEVTCLQDNPDLNEYCRALWANVGSCQADQLMAVLGLTGEPTADIKAAVAKIETEQKKLKPDELEKMKVAYNSPNTQLRGLLEVKIKSTADECRLTVGDLYETFSYGQKRKMENIVGTGQRFVLTPDNYVFEDCRDTANLVALASPGATAEPGTSAREGWKVGQGITFRYVGKDERKASGGCTYSMDTFWDYEAASTAVPVTEADGKLDWAFSASATKKGRHIAHMYRYKTCGAKPAERMSVSCQVIEAE